MLTSDQGNAFLFFLFFIFLKGKKKRKTVTSIQFPARCYHLFDLCFNISMFASLCGHMRRRWQLLTCWLQKCLHIFYDGKLLTTLTDVCPVRTGADFFFFLGGGYFPCIASLYLQSGLKTTPYQHSEDKVPCAVHYRAFLQRSFDFSVLFCSVPHCLTMPHWLIMSLLLFSITALIQHKAIPS